MTSVAKDRKKNVRAEPRETVEARGPAPESLASRAYRQLEDLIVRLEIKPGRPMSENELSVTLGIGRTPIREALQRLEREGLIVISPRRGLFVTEVRVDAQLRLLEVRRSLERMMATRAARLAESSERTAFARVAEEMRAAGNGGNDIEFLRLDKEFNELISRTARNEFASAAISLTAGLSRRFWFRYYQSMADLPLTCNLHADVAAAIAKGDPELAGESSDRLMNYIEAFTRSVFETVV